MYAVIISGGKQHRVEEGEVLKLKCHNRPHRGHFNARHRTA
ncbi:bL21 family ribosomal protein [Luminiphilus sp.]|nr:bL21 family ribosomal protein [Luminiphilus sp.]